MNPNILNQILKLASCGKQEIMMMEASYLHDIKVFIKPDNKHSFEFKTCNSLESPHRYVFKRRLKDIDQQESKISIAADFLEAELKEYDKRKRGLHDHLVFMYTDSMLEFDMKHIQEWFIEKSPNPETILVRTNEGILKMIVVYFIPMNIPHTVHNYLTPIVTRDSIYNKWKKQPDAEPTKAPAPQATFISPYF